MLAIPTLMLGQIPYGNNSEVGKYVETEDANIYYEVYGDGQPLLLLHGSLYGYIDEYTRILPTLADQFTVFAVALRGHGKSEVGDRDYSYQLFAEDAMKVLEHESIDRTAVMGFSSGAITAVKIAANYPDKVTKVVSIAGVLAKKDANPGKKLTGQEFVDQAKEFVERRKTLMPEPDRFIEFFDQLHVADVDSVWVSDEKASHIKAPVLVIGGDRDAHFDVKGFARTYNMIPNASLLILPESGHVDVLLNQEVYTKYAIPFLEK